jgi:hypothetical protein
MGSWFVARSTAVDDPAMRVFLDRTPFESPLWMDTQEASIIEQLDAISRKRHWSTDDAAVVLTSLRRPMPAPLSDDSPAQSLTMPAPGASATDVQEWLQRPGAVELVSWLTATHRSTLAWGYVKERLRLNLGVPDSVREYSIQHWLESLGSPDPSQRLESASSLIYTRSVEDPAIRVRLDAMRLSDPDVSVRDAIDRGLQHYDRTHNGVEPSGPTSECNTCP